MTNHKTRKIKVWVDVDVKIAEMVLYLNKISGIRTLASCQGTISEGGQNSYRPQVMATWTDEAFERIKKEFDVTILGDHWGYLHPKQGLPSK
jgi:tRNA(Phe) wybutosine-synthesizing methylase Tyw3